MKRLAIFSVLVPIVFIYGCAGSRVSTVKYLTIPKHPVRTIALDPGGGILAE